MSSLQELMGETSAPLSDLIVESPTVSTLPEATARNRAALIAIQSDNPEDVVPNYQTMMAENTEGSDATMQELSTSIQGSDQENDFQALMDVLSDPNTPTESKPALVQAFQTSNRLKDPSYSLADKSLIAGSAGENQEQETVRLNLSDMLNNYMRQKSEMQGLTNQFILDNAPEGLDATVDTAALFIPGEDAITNTAVSEQIYNALGMEYSAGNKLRDFAFPGFSALAVREHLDKLSPADRVESVSKILNIIKSNSAVMAGDENQVRAMQMLERFVVGDYDNTDAVIDSVFNVLDMIGLGLTAKAGVKALRGSRSVQIAEEVGEVGQAAEKPVEAVSKAPRPTTMPAARINSKAQDIERLEQEHANLLAQQQSVLDKGSVASLKNELKNIVNQYRNTERAGPSARIKQLQSEGASYKSAKATAQKELNNQLDELKIRREALENKLKINARTSQASQKLAEVEKKLAAARSNTATVPAVLNPIADSINRIERNSILGIENPASAGSIMSDMNPEKGRALFASVFASPTDDLSQAAFGMSKDDYVVSQIMPQVGTESGIVRSKVADIERSIEVPLDEEGIRFSDKERAYLTNQVANDFKNANGLLVHDAESAFSVTPDGGKIKVSAMYGTTEGGFLRAEDAVDQAKLAFRQYGLNEKDMVVMKKNGLNYEPVNLEDVRGIEGDYKIRIDTEVDQRADLMGDGWEAFDVKRNFFDRYSATMFDGAGSVTRMLTDAASNFHPNFAGSFSVAADRAVSLEKTLLKYADRFSKKYISFPENRKNKIWDYLLEANQKGIPYDLTDLRARGFTDEETLAMGDFRNFWDFHYQLENLDVVRTLRARGFEYVETKNGDSFFAHKLPKNKNYNKVYDPSVGDIRYLTKDEMDDLYDNGGTVALFKSPVDIDGSTAEYVMVRNNTDEYLRMIRDDDKVLNYREGYFQINYKAPQYIREVDGERTRAVAVRGSKLDAQIEAKRLSSVNGKEYIVTGDDRVKDHSFDSFWDINQTSGRIAQRRRGQLLEGAEGLNVVDGKEFVENPIDSAIRAARSIAGRTVSRPAVETAKARALKQYGHMLPKDQYGRPIYPENPKALRLTGEYTTKELSDARTTFEYIHRFENGYINSIDELTKALFNSIANGLGDLNVKTGGGLGYAENLARRASEKNGPSGFLRGTAFQAYIALNPFRNWIMQPAQVARTFAYNPIDWANGRIPSGIIGISNALMGRKVSSDVQQMFDALSDTGMLDAVDRSNMVRGAMLQASDASNAAMRGLSKISTASRTAGFDIGEKFNLIGHYVAVWNKYKRQGANMSDKRTLALIHNEARSIAGEMNRAGDFAYNENFLSIPFQFAQVPHKFLLTATNRKIDRLTRARMMAGDIILWGVPGTYAVSSWIGNDVLPDDPDLRDIIVSGLASWNINRAIQTVMGDDTEIDFSSLAPYNLGSFVDVFHAMAEEGYSSMLLNTPSGQLFFKDTGRLGAAWKSLMRHFTPINEGLETPETILDTVNQFAKISSGWNNITKAWFAAHTGMTVDKNNLPVDTRVTIAEAIALGFGFQTKDTMRHYDTIGKLIDNQKNNEQVAKDVVNSIFQMYASAYQGQSALDPEYITRLSGAVMTYVQKNPILAKEVYRQMKIRLKDPQDSIMRSILKAIQMPTVENAESIIRGSDLTDEKKQQALDFLAARNKYIEKE